MRYKAVSKRDHSRRIAPIYPSVAFSILMTLAGLPITSELSGTSKFTKEFGAIRTFVPIVIFPTITAFAPIQFLSPRTGDPFNFPRFVRPIVTPWVILQFLPILVFSLITILPKCEIKNPSPIYVDVGI
jgi:hypothetical protein